MDIKISPIKEGDIILYSALIKRVIRATPYYTPFSKSEEIWVYSPERLKRKIAKPNVMLLKAVVKNKLAGFITGGIGTGMLHIIWVGVDKKFRNFGVSIELVKAAEKWAKKKKAHKTWLDTRTNNKESIGLFKKLNYRKAATLNKHYYGLDFYIWEKLTA